MSLDARMQAIWYGSHPASALLLPLSWGYRLALACRGLLYKVGILPAYRAPAPVIVVGNLTVGGAGKTPLVIWLARYLQSRGYRPGIISRGYGARSGRGAFREALAWARGWLSRNPGDASRARQVGPDSDPALTGDEPALLAQRTGRPVAIAAARAGAAAAILQQTDCDILISDDGLQHTALARDIEIMVIDGQRRLGNRRCLPAGPLREPARRLDSVDMIVANAGARAGEFQMNYRSLPARSLDGREERTLESFKGQEAHAVAAIGNPERFFATLRRAGIRIRSHVFPDHFRYRRADLEFDDDLIILMTEKDAVKCRRLAPDNAWYVPVEANLPEAFEHRLNVLLKEVEYG